MRKIEAIIRKEKFSEVQQALEKSGVGGMTAIEAKGFGQRRTGLKDYVKIEIYTDEFQIDKVLDTIRRKAKTGSAGDGQIAVLPLEKLYRIRTGEEGAHAV